MMIMNEVNIQLMTENTTELFSKEIVGKVHFEIQGQRGLIALLSHKEDIT